MFHAGTITYRDQMISCKAPDDLIITGAAILVKGVFDAGSTNNISIGTDSGASNIMPATAVESTGAKQADAFTGVSMGEEIKVKYSQSGTKATFGRADIYLFAIGVTPDAVYDVNEREVSLGGAGMQEDDVDDDF